MISPTDRFDAIGALEEQLARAFPGLQPDWEIRGQDPVLHVRIGATELEVVPLDGGRFQLVGTVAAAQAVDVVKALVTVASSAPAPREVSRRLAAASTN